MTEARQAVIHDLGYRPYEGPRRPSGRRFLVIARNVLTVAWRSRWGVKLPAIVAGIATVIVAAFMWAMGNRLAEDLRANGLPLPRADALIFRAMPFLGFLGFILSTSVGCASVADDLRTGAFTFYFSRPIRPRDYVTGKLLGVCLVVGIALLAPPLVLGLYRPLLADGPGEMLRTLDVLPRALAIGIVDTIAFAAPAAALGALIRRRRIAQAAYAIYYIAVAPAATGMAKQLDVPWVALASMPHDMEVVGRALFGIDAATGSPPVWAAAAAIAAVCGLAWAIMLRRVARAETTGLGVG